MSGWAFIGEADFAAVTVAAQQYPDNAERAINEVLHNEVDLSSTAASTRSSMHRAGPLKATKHRPRCPIGPNTARMRILP